MLIQLNYVGSRVYNSLNKASIESECRRAKKFVALSSRVNATKPSQRIQVVRELLSSGIW